MGTAYKIRCRHCGAQFEHHMQPGYGVLPVCVGCGEYVEKKQAIRSGRLDNSADVDESNSVEPDGTRSRNTTD